MVSATGFSKPCLGCGLTSYAAAPPPTTFPNPGNDSTGSGTQVAPYKSIAKAQAIHDASSGDIALVFKAGDEWNETTGLSITKTNVTVASYGYGAKPLFNRFTVKYNSTGWTLSSGTKYTRTESNDIAWIRNQAARLTPYKRASSSALTDGQWFWGSNTLTIDIGVNPNTLNLEAVISNTDYGIDLSGDGSVAIGIRADGFGCHRTNTATQCEGIHFSPVGTDTVGAVACESYYCSSHSLAFNNATLRSGVGGQAYLEACKTGYSKYNAAGDTQYNFFSNAGHKVVMVNCENTYGTLPSSDWPTTNPYSGGIFYTHCNRPSLDLIGLVLIVGHTLNTTITGTQTGPGDYGAFGDVNLPTVNQDMSNLADCRAFVVNSMLDVRNTAVLFNGAGTNSAWINNRITCYPPDGPRTGLAPANGIDINGQYLYFPTTNNWAACRLWNTDGGNSTTTNGQTFLNCQFFIEGTGKQIGDMGFASTNAPNLGARMGNCVVSFTGLGDMTWGGQNDSTHLQGNAFYNVHSATFNGWAGVGNGSGQTTLAYEPGYESYAVAPSPAGVASPFNLTVEFDANWVRRSATTPAAGPFELGGPTAYSSPYIAPRFNTGAMFILLGMFN